MATNGIKIFLVEDNKHDIALTTEMLTKLNGDISLIAESMAEFQVKIKDPKSDFDFVLLDLHLPDSKGLETVITARKLLDEADLKCTAIVVLTCIDDYELSMNALKNGAKDYLTKDNLNGTEFQRAINFATFTKDNPKRRKPFVEQFKSNKE